eukprot:2613111-Alexandrium_andersonii.AAC.1
MTGQCTSVKSGTNWTRTKARPDPSPWFGMRTCSSPAESARRTCTSPPQATIPTLPRLYLCLSRDQDVDEDEAALLPQQQQMGQSGRLNYQRHKQGKLSKLDTECAVCPDRLIFNHYYKDFRIDVEGTGLPKGM